MLFSEIKTGCSSSSATHVDGGGHHPWHSRQCAGSFHGDRVTSVCSHRKAMQRSLDLSPSCPDRRQFLLAVERMWFSTEASPRCYSRLSNVHREVMGEFIIKSFQKGPVKEGVSVLLSA